MYLIERVASPPAIQTKTKQIGRFQKDFSEQKYLTNDLAPNKISTNERFRHMLKEESVVNK